MTECNITIRDYRDLDVWKRSHELTVEIYLATKEFPKEEAYGLTSQIRRAAYSVPSNIAEGNGRHHLKEYIQALYISRSSLHEVKYFLLLSKDIGYLDEKEYNELINKTERVGMMLMGLIRSLKKGKI